ncbi:MAG TPA: PqqD family protein [Thermoanaerobaculia bacterium]|nr:PqqD family protein [Thermoanaerobaculia bacterium]
MSVFQRSPDVVCRQVGAESVLVPIRHNVGNLDFVYTLSAVASRVWSLLDGTHDIDGIADVICEEFDVDRETASTDIRTLVSDLGEAALVSQVS